MIWKRVRLELGKSGAFPNGSRMHGYDLVAPLDADGVIGEAAWRENPTRATVKRFWQGELEKRGGLVRMPDGAWAFDFKDGAAPQRLDTPALKVGDHVSVTDDRGAAQSFRVAAVRVLAMA